VGGQVGTWKKEGGESPDHLACLPFRGSGSTGFIARVYLQTSILFCISLLYSLSRPSKHATTRARDEEWRHGTPKWANTNQSLRACGIRRGQARSRGVEGCCARPAHALSLQYTSHSLTTRFDCFSCHPSLILPAATPFRIAFYLPHLKRRNPSAKSPGRAFSTRTTLNDLIYWSHAGNLCPLADTPRQLSREFYID